MNFKDNLALLPEGIRLLSCDKIDYYISDLLEISSNIRIDFDFESGDEVVLKGLNTHELVLTLLALDGFVKRLIIVSDEFILQSVEHTVLVEKGLMQIRISQPKTSKLLFTEWVLFTSGTTGTPKKISHDFLSLTHSCKEYKHSDIPFKWCLMYESSRFAGLQVLLQSLLSGSQLFIPSNSSFESILKCILDKRPNCISCTPSFLRKLLLNHDFQNLSFKQITLGGEAVDYSILNFIIKKFPTARLTHIYASTEAGVGFSVKDKLPGFPSSWLNDQHLSPVPMKLSNRSTLMLKPHRIARGKEIEERLEGDYFDTQDVVEVVNDRVLFKGRENGVLNIGGNKVFPDEIEQIIRSISHVSQVRVYGKESSILGQIVAADVVLFKEYKDINAAAEIKQFCSKKLSHWKVPAFVRIVSDIEISKSGKLKRL